jgi:hypothetical protein
MSAGTHRPNTVPRTGTAQNFQLGTYFLCAVARGRQAKMAFSPQLQHLRINPTSSASAPDDFRGGEAEVETFHSSCLLASTS